jgi:hypothetical protein
MRCTCLKPNIKKFYVVWLNCFIRMNHLKGMSLKDHVTRFLDHNVPVLNSSVGKCFTDWDRFKNRFHVTEISIHQILRMPRTHGETVSAILAIRWAQRLRYLILEIRSESC